MHSALRDENGSACQVPVANIVKRWNFLYVGGTTLLTYTYSAAERFRAQAVNEFAVFGMSATASLLAGTVMFLFGWNMLMWLPIPILVAITAALVWVRRDPLMAGRG